MDILVNDERVVTREVTSGPSASLPPLIAPPWR
jgi:hypothetical protein